MNLMTRCTSCNGIIAKSDVDCYSCGDPVPGAPKGLRRLLLRLLTSPAAPPKTVVTDDPSQVAIARATSTL